MVSKNALSSVGIIPDGNRRYAKKAGLGLPQAYAMGVKKAKEAVEWLDETPSVKHVTFYTLSLENLQRNQNELSVLMRLFRDQIQTAVETNFFKENDISPKFIGRTDLLPEKIQDVMRSAEERNQDFSRTVNFAVAYTGQAEIIDAAKKIALRVQRGELSVDDVNESSFNDYLYTPTNPDLIFRTGNVHRLSGFMTYQSAYSEYYFSQKLWPEITKNDFRDALQYYEDTQRNFGK